MQVQHVIRFRLDYPTTNPFCPATNFCKSKLSSIQVMTHTEMVAIRRLCNPEGFACMHAQSSTAKRGFLAMAWKYLLGSMLPPCSSIFIISSPPQPLCFFLLKWLASLASSSTDLQRKSNLVHAASRVVWQSLGYAGNIWQEKMEMREASW